MALSLEKIEKAYKVLKGYSGENSHIIQLKNIVYAYKTRGLKDIELEYVLSNYDREPRQINKIVKIADWYGEKLHSDLLLDFVPQKLKITWFLGETDKIYHFFCIYRRSQEKAMEVFVPKRAILTDFLLEDFHNLDIDLSKYSTDKRTVMPHQLEAVKFLLSRKKCILADEMGGGKMEPISSLIPTPDGYKKMGDIKTGDYVFGDDGLKHKVLNTFYHTNKDIYTVHFSDGTSVECGLEHLWLVKNDSWKNEKWRVLSVQDIIKQGIKRGKKRPINKFQIPITEPVHYEEKKYFIDPYILGVCIGDGNLCSGGINISIPDFEKETAERISTLLHNGYKLSKNTSASCPRYRIVSSTGYKTNLYNSEIKRLGLNVHGNFKFIPEEYKIGSVKQRVDLLRGLMDSDGYISKEKNKISYYTNSLKLAKDVCELVCSLGGISRLHEYKRIKYDKETTEYKITIEIKLNPFYLKHKSERYNPTFKKYCKRYIDNITFSKKEDAQCLSVDSINHTYLTGKNYHVTHNTFSAILAALQGNFKHVLVICPSSVKKTWENELKYLVDEKDITIVQGSKWDDAKFTIINYDILDNFYTIPKQTIKKKELNVDDDGKVVTEYKEKEIVSRSKKIIDEAMSQSQLFQAEYDLVIIDEAHRLSNNTSGRFKIISDLLKRSRPSAIFELTGTMITNSSKNLYNLLKIIDNPVTKDWQHYMERYCGAKIFYKKNERKAYTAIFCKEHNKKDWDELTYDEKRELDDVLEKKCQKLVIPGEDTNMEELQEIIKPYYLRRLKSDFKEMVNKNIRILHYEMTEDEKLSYNNLWEQYLELQNDKEKTEKNKKLIETSLMRQWLADKMIPRTISLVNKCIDLGHKVIIFCAYDNEIKQFVEAFGNQCVFHNGKINEKKKNEAVEAFQNNPEVKVFIGNIFSAGVGISLTSATVCVFNNFSFVPADNLQAEDRIHRLNQTRPCTIYYQSFNETYYDKMLEIIHNKETVINKIIVTEKNK